MNFLAPELIRAIGYSIIIPSFVAIGNRAWRSHNYDLSILAATLALNYAWLFLDLTMVASGQSTRETRTIATPLTILVAFGAASLALHPQVSAWRHRRKKPADGAQVVSYRH